MYHDMERFGPRGNVLSFGNDTSSSRQPATEDDGVDVFGGPPKRLSSRRDSFAGEGSERLWPVYGEKPVFGQSTRHTTSDDFYDDIFRRSDDSHAYASPRRSSPMEPLASPQFSLPARLTKAIDLRTFGSSSSSRSPHRYKEEWTSLSRFSSQSMQEHDESHEFSVTGSTRSNSNKNTVRTAAEFHFSIHKWADRGVPLLNSLRGGRNPTFKDSSKVSPLSDFSNQDSSQVSETGLSTTDEVESQGDEEIRRKAQGAEKITGLPKSKVDKTQHVWKKMDSNKKGEVNKPAVGSPKKVKGKVRDFVKIFNHQGLNSRWNSNKIDSEVRDIIPDLDTTVLAVDDKTVPDASRTIKVGAKVPLDSVKDTESGHNLAAKNVNMMSDASSKVPADNVKMKVDDSKLAADKVKIVPDTSSVAKERIEKQQVRRIRKVSDVSFGETDASPSTGTLPKVTTENIDDPSLENFQVEELSEDKASKIEESTSASDSKIRVWSDGRKGNIRSLLSTLQLVLWAESGWRPVALVDIIEANAVKKAYNRAMLCLHPDKLQQKGAACHQKYLAEKVFDILQEAWDFNTLGTL